MIYPLLSTRKFWCIMEPIRVAAMEVDVTMYDLRSFKSANHVSSPRRDPPRRVQLPEGTDIVYSLSSLIGGFRSKLMLAGLTPKVINPRE